MIYVLYPMFWFQNQKLYIRNLTTMRVLNGFSSYFACCNLERKCGETLWSLLYVVFKIFFPLVTSNVQLLGRWQYTILTRLKCNGVIKIVENLSVWLLLRVADTWISSKFQSVHKLCHLKTVNFWPPPTLCCPFY